MTKPTLAQSEAMALLENAIDLKDAQGVEGSLISIWSTGLNPAMCGALTTLVEAPWHRRHEDVVRAIQQLQCASAVPALERAALAAHDYLNYDAFFGLARKCTWALADIGTPEARSALERLAQSSNPQVAAYAGKRLDRWQDELARKSERSHGL